MTHTHTHTNFRVDVGKSRKHAEKNGWPEGQQACDGMKTKNKLRQARRTRSPLQHAARKGAARTGAGCREAVLRPTQSWLGRPAVEHENGRPTGKQQVLTVLRATIEQATHVRIHGLEKGVSENEAPGPVGAYTTIHNNTPTQRLDRCSESHSPNLIHQISFTESHSQN